jgi:hypothetical protein
LIIFQRVLDSKCYPLLKNEDTSSEDFRKTTKKITAAPKQAYKKLGGVLAGSKNVTKKGTKQVASSLLLMQCGGNPHDSCVGAALQDFGCPHTGCAEARETAKTSLCVSTLRATSFSKRPESKHPSAPKKTMPRKNREMMSEILCC